MLDRNKEARNRRRGRFRPGTSVASEEALAISDQNCEAWFRAIVSMSEI